MDPEKMQQEAQDAKNKRIEDEAKARIKVRGVFAARELTIRNFSVIM